MNRAQSYLVLGTFSFTMMDISAKYLAPGFSIGQILFVRYSLAFVLILAYGLLLAKENILPRSKLHFHFLRGFFTFFTISAIINGLRFASVAEVSSILYLAPIFTVLISQLNLKEPGSFKNYVQLVLCLAGAALCLLPKFEQFPVGVLLLFLGAFANSMTIVLSKVLSKDNPPFSILFSEIAALFVCSVLYFLLFSPWTEVASTQERMSFVGISVFGIGGALFSILAYARSKSSELAPFEYLSLVWAVGLGFLFFQSTPTPLTLLGIGIIMMSLFLNLQRRVYVAS